MHRFRRLRVWNDAVELAARTYQLTSAFPTDERFGLVTQMRRAEVSVSSNIAEGAGRGTPKEMARFLRLAIGSLCELESQVEVSKRLGHIDDEQGLLSDASILKSRIKALEDRILVPDT